MTVDEVLAKEAMSMGRPVHLVDAWMFVPEVIVVVYDCEPILVRDEDWVMDERRATIWTVGGSASVIVWTKFYHKDDLRKEVVLH